jgi:hypothetical protein
LGRAAARPYGVSAIDPDAIAAIDPDAIAAIDLDIDEDLRWMRYDRSAYY